MKRKHIRRVSKKRAKDLREYSKLSNQYLSEHPACEICGVHGDLQLHHKKGRGIYLCATEYFMAVCFWCHKKVENERAWAMKQRYLLDRIGHD